MLVAAGAPELYLHLDVDALDSSEGRANSYAVPGGLSRADLLAAVDAIGARGGMCAASITAYDPACDTDGRIGGIAIEAARRMVSAARSKV
jgi:arginase